MNDNRSSIETVIKNLTAQIDEMQQKAAQVDTDARDEYDRQIGALKAQKRQAEQKLAELEASNKGAVEDIKSGLQQVWDDVKETVGDAVARFK